MSRKKSLDRAIEQVRSLSLTHPSATLFVLDKARERSVVISNVSIVERLVKTGWHIDSLFVNGMKWRLIDEQ